MYMIVVSVQRVLQLTEHCSLGKLVKQPKKLATIAEITLCVNHINPANYSKISSSYHGR